VGHAPVSVASSQKKKPIQLFDALMVSGSLIQIVHIVQGFATGRRSADMSSHKTRLAISLAQGHDEWPTVA
jgi:hypothetical protein